MMLLLIKDQIRFKQELAEIDILYKQNQAESKKKGKFSALFEDSVVKRLEEMGLNVNDRASNKKRQS